MLKGLATPVAALQARGNIVDNSTWRRKGGYVVPENGLNVGCVVSAPFEQNTYIAHLSGRHDCVVFDPGFELEAVFEYLEELGLTPAAIVCTHGHSDHIAGNAALKRRWLDCPLIIGAGDAEKL